jgi:hypothetical protein
MASSTEDEDGALALTKLVQAAMMLHIVWAKLEPFHLQLFHLLHSAS